MNFLKVKYYVFSLVILMLVSGFALAQNGNKYMVKDGRMFIVMDKLSSSEKILEFMSEFNLSDLPLIDFINGRMMDSLNRLGWILEANDKHNFIISKELKSFKDNFNIADKHLYIGQENFALRFPVESPNVLYGYNDFRGKFSFRQEDSVVTFYLKGYEKARRVVLSGSFIEWSPDEIRMTKVDSGWIHQLKLRPGKYWYKFIVDGSWITDPDNTHEEHDGLGNVNSTFFVYNHLFRLDGHHNAREVFVTGSFNNWDKGQLRMSRTTSGWEFPVYIANGTHTYRFVVDGKWMTDPANEEKMKNENGEFNSVLKRGRSYLFFLQGFEEAGTISIHGSFNQYRRNEIFLNKVTGGWELPFNLQPGNYDYALVIDGKELELSNGSFIVGANYSFKLKGFPNAREVYLAGDFNNWSPDKFLMKKEGDSWVIPVYLKPGKHLYKFIVDGKWITDPDNRDWEQNEYGTGNSVLWFD